VANPFNILGKVVSGETIGGAADKKILKKVNPVLTSAERRRITNESTIAAEAFFNVQKKNEKDTFGETDRASTPAGMAKESVQKTKEEKPPKLKFPLLLALGAGITAFAAWIADFIGPVAEFIAKTLPKLLKPMGKLASGFFKAMKGGKLGKILAGLAKGIGGRLLKFGRFIPVIGSLFSFGFGISRWKKGQYIPALFEFASGILNLLPFGVTNIASMIIDGALLIYDLNQAKKEKEGIDPTGGQFDMWGKIKEFAMKLPGIQNIISLGKGIGAVFRGEWAEAGEHFNEALPFVGSVISWLAGAGESIAKGTGFVLGKAGDFFASIKDKFVGIFTGIVDNVMGGLKSFGKKFSTVGSGVKAAFKALVPGGESPIEAFKRVVYADDFARFNDGTLVNFNSRDDVVGMKEGGTLSKLIKGAATESIAIKDVFDKAVAAEVKRSNQLLAQLVQLTAQIAKNGSNNTTPVVVQNPLNDEMSGTMEGPSYTDTKTNFLNSAYTMQPT
jgi:hypothetical protein